MCTVTWLRGSLPDGDDYLLFSNRDESRTRLRAEPPQVETIAGVQVLAPRDADAGGTWIAANELGTTVCLLNRQGVRPQKPPISRGFLVRNLADAVNVADVTERLDALDLGSYRPFTLIAIDPHSETLFWWEDGETLKRDTAPQAPLASSSHQRWPEVISARRKLWQEINPHNEADLLQFHHNHQPTRGVLSPCMHRTLAKTVSLTCVRVAADQVEMTYTDGAPCKHLPGEPSVLARAASLHAKSPSS